MSTKFRIIRNAGILVPFAWYDATVGPPKLNAAGAPGTLNTKICKDDGAAFNNVTAAGASTVTQEIGQLNLIVADTDFKKAMIRISCTNALSPTVMFLETEECLESGVFDTASSTTAKLRLRAGASAVDEAYRFKMLEIVKDTGAPTIEGLKRLIWHYDGVNKDAYFITPLPTATTDNTGIYTITELSPGEALTQLLYEAGVKTGAITAGVSTTGFTAADLAGLGTNALVNSVAMLVSGAGGANNGLLRQATGYTSGTGAVVCDALPAAPSVGDLVALFGSFG